VKTQLSRACGVLPKLKHYTTQSVLKVVCNSLIHPYLNHSILNWGRASNPTIQSLIKLENKAIKIIKPSNTKSLEEPFQHYLKPSQNLYFISRQIHALLSQQTASKPLEHKTGIDLTVSSTLKKPSKTIHVLF